MEEYMKKLFQEDGLFGFFGPIHQLLLLIALVCAVLGLMYVGMLTGKVGGERFRSEAPSYERLASDTCIPNNWRERAKCYHPPGECTPRDWRELAKCYNS